MQSYEWYAQLKKPFFAPPSSIFGPVWGVLYIIIFSTFGYVFSLYLKKKVPFSIIIPFFLNLVFNFAFTPLQFGLKNNYLALLDILLVLTTLIWAMCKIYPFSKLVSLLQLPYLIWVSFATVLQISITYLNH